MIYCVEDDDQIRELIVYALSSSGFLAAGFQNGSEFWKNISNKRPELILLDIMLPGESGVEILKKLKSSIAFRDIPVIMVSAKSTEFDKVIGLDMGADDYIIKPFGMMELLSRVKAVLRRVVPKSSENSLCLEGILMDLERHAVLVDGEEIFLTLKEYDMLKYLLSHQGVVATRDQLLGLIWGYDFDGETRTVDVHIRTLRQKLKEAGELIETVRGVGYRMGKRTL